MSVKDVIKKSVYERLGGGTGLSAITILLLLLVSALIGLYIFCVYKKQSKAAFYSKDFNLTIACLPIVVCAIMIAMQSNLIVSLGMVGALSIVRFRNAVKNPLDLLYCFWSISAGIICGVGLVVLSLLLCMAVTLAVILLQLFPNEQQLSVVVLTSSGELEWDELNKTLYKYGKRIKEKAKSYKMGKTEVIYELFTKDEDSLINELKKIGFESIVFLSHDGEYRV